MKNRKKPPFPAFGHWSPDMGSISGQDGMLLRVGKITLSGDEYEQTLQDLVRRITRYLQKQAGTPPHHIRRSDETREVFGFVQEKLQVPDFEQALAEIVQSCADPNRPPSQHQAEVALAHSLMIWHRGWELYVEKMRDFAKVKKLLTPTNPN